MKKKKIDSRLVKYSAAAGATVLGASAAQGGIVYTNLDNVVLLGGTASYNIAVDGTNKFSIFQHAGTTNTVTTISSASQSMDWRSAAIGAQTSAASWRENTGGVLALTKSDAVDSLTPWGRFFPNLAFDRSIYNSLVGTYYSNGGNFINTNNKYIGIKFDIGAGTHYGWIQLDINADVSEVTINGWAYNDVAGEGIAAGAIPEPGSLALLALGAAGICLFRKHYSQV